MTSADFCLATSLLCAVGSLQGFVSTTEVLEAPRETKFHLSDSRISRALHIFKELLIHPFAELTPWFPEKMILPQKGLLNLPKLCLNFCEIKGPELSAAQVFPRALERCYRGQQSAWGFGKLQSRDAQLSR